MRGASLAELTVSKAMSGTVTGSLDLTREQVQSLQNGRLYVQISSEKAPDGNLWGWLVRSQEAQRYARPEKSTGAGPDCRRFVQPHARGPTGGPAAGRYTAAQAAAGRTTYQAQCSSCHQPDLKGQGDAAQLAGSEFIDSWGRRSTRELLSFMQLTMPPARPGALSPEEYANVAAFILQSNGASAGNQPLTATTEVAINTIATGQAPAARRGRASTARCRSGGRRRAAEGGERPRRRWESPSPAK